MTKSTKAQQDSKLVSLRLPQKLVELVEAHRAELEARGEYASWSDAARNLIVRGLEAANVRRKESKR